MTLPDVDAVLRDIRQGEQQRDRLLAITKESRSWVANNLPASEGTVRALLEAACDQEPRESLATARAALQMALELRRPLVLESLVEVGNALRRCGDLRQAAKTLAVADELRSITGIDPLTTARYFSILSSLRNVQRDYHGAIKAASNAKRLYSEYGTPRLRVRELVKEALIHSDHDELDSAMKVGDVALRAARELGDFELMRIAHNNLCCALVELKMVTPARNMAKIWFQLYSKTARSAELIRSRWLNARLDLAEGNASNAVKPLTEVCDFFAETGYGWEYLVACMHLGQAHLAQGDTAKVTAITSRLAELCEWMEVPQPKLAAVSFHSAGRFPHQFRHPKKGSPRS